MTAFDERTSKRERSVDHDKVYSHHCQVKSLRTTKKVSVLDEGLLSPQGRPESYYFQSVQPSDSKMRLKTASTQHRTVKEESIEKPPTVRPKGPPYLSGPPTGLAIST